MDLCPLCQRPALELWEALIEGVSHFAPGLCPGCVADLRRAGRDVETKP